MMWRALSALLLAASIGGCGFAGVNPRGVGSAPGQAGHQVAAGESIQSIAAQYGTTVDQIATRNGLTAPYQLTVGQRLVLPAPATYVVQQGETMDLIARRYGITPAELARVNGIGAPYPVQPGQTLTIPTGQGTGGVVATAAPSGSVQVSSLPPPGAVTGTALPPAVGTGTPVSDSAGVATGAPVPLVDAPATGGVATLDQPQVYTLQPPGAADAQGLPPAAPGLDTTASGDTATLPATNVPPATGAGGLPSLSGSGFQQPVTGQVLSRFGEGNPVPNDGVNIAAPAGTPIHAAEAGVVAYVGEDIETFGNLVLIRHADGWVTAYGHAQAILVGEGDVVTRGQTIGRVGATGSVAVPQLHFELRRGTEPVDPLAYLEG